MSSNALRQAVYSLLQSSPELAGLGYNGDTLLPAFTPDAPNADRFCVLRWGATALGIGPANSVTFTAWFYNREPDFSPIMDAIAATRQLIPTLVSQRFSDGSGAVLGATWAGDTDDAYDDGYRAYVRNTAFTLTASGT